MTQIDFDRGAEPTLRSRSAGHIVMGKCLRAQDDAPRRSRVARLLGTSPLHPDAVAWYEGALSELETGRQLAALGAPYTVLHSLPLGESDGDADSDLESDVDHLVIGSAGVFCLSSAHAVTASQIADAQRAARRVSKHLSRALQRVVPVSPVLVHVGGVPAKGRSDEIDVIPSRGLSRWFSSRPPVLTSAEITNIALAAEQPATWRAPSAAVGTVVDVSEFDVLQHEVEAATVRERAAVAVSVTVGIGVVIVTAAEIVAYLMPLLAGR